MIKRDKKKKNEKLIDHSRFNFIMNLNTTYVFTFFILLLVLSQRCIKMIGSIYAFL